MTTLPQQANFIHHHALVRHDGNQSGGLADYGSPGSGPSEFGEGPRSIHRGFFVRGRQYDQGLIKPLDVQAFNSAHHQGKEAFHVGNAETIKLVVFFGQREWIDRPQSLIKRHGIGVPGEH